MAFGAVVVLSVTWIVLAQTVLFVGPSEWDDNAYCDVAAVPQKAPDIAARYFHIWTVRLFVLVMNNRQAACGLYPTLLTVGLIWLGFFAGRRIGGPWCGLLAAFLMPFYPSLLKYITVPYTDTPMALWGGFGILCALAATTARSPRRRTLALLASGAFFVWSTQCKETGIAALPAILMAVWGAPRPRRGLATWIGGAAAGWLAFSTLDLIFLGDFFWHWHLGTYLPNALATAGPGGGTGTVLAANRMNQHYLYMLLMTHRKLYYGDFLVFTLLGAAGAVAGWRKSLDVRCIAVWFFSVMAISSALSCHFHGVQAIDRYCVAMGVPLVILASGWSVRLWRHPTTPVEGDSRARTYVLAAIVLLMYGGAAAGLIIEAAGEATASTVRLDFFLLPPTLLVLFLVPWLAPGRVMCRAAIVLLLLASCAYNVRTAILYRDNKRNQLEPWVTLVEQLDKAKANLVRWDLPDKPFTRLRIERRVRTLSTRPADEIQVRDVTSPAEIREGEWMICSNDLENLKMIMRAGWQPIWVDAARGMALGGTQGGVTWIVCVRRGPTGGGP